ncbi:MAG: gliding motility-associated C-terminal domain-containing protein [Bacteroidetes bacterium]|nr:gliding motility-associated C-terminal domain-containing protein [Bacteroidota bacterium]
MKKILASIAFFSVLTMFSQNDNCAFAPMLSINATCSSPVAGTSAGATQSIPGCVGTADDDVWYQFVASATSVSMQVTPSASYDAVVEVFSGPCSSLVSLTCVDNGLSGGVENVSVSGLTIGSTYSIRIYHYFVGSGSSTFTICLTNSPPPPANDFCGGAVNLAVNAGCIGTAGNSYGATQSYAGCTGTADDDVWFSFTANNYTQTIQVTGSANMDAVVELFSGPCGSLSSLNCQDVTFSGGIETINAVGLTPGVVYYVRVYDYYAGGGYPFSICVSGSPIGAGQPNDNPCSALQLPAVTSDCNYLQFSTVGATQTPTTIAPAPASCAGGGPPAMGGFTTTTKDVWFKITVPASGKVYITPQPNLGAGYISDGVMAIYSGACNALTQIACSDDYTAYPGSANDLLPYLAVIGQAPGSTLYLRYWAFGTSSGTFGICVQSPSNDNCSSSLYICDLNGYAGSTSAAYTIDRPCNMRGNAEMAGTYSYTPGTNQGGIFGQGGPWGAGSPAFDVQINNNSWIKFTAAATSAAFNINIGNCWVGAYPSGGIQMQIFSAASACCNFTPVSNFKEGSSTFSIGATGLTVGNDYYLMIDGYAGDICNYSINALTGVSFGNIVASPDSICPGGSSILTGPSGASSYSWLPGGASTQTIQVNPGSTITYTCIANGVCGFKQTITKKIVVKALPTVQINSGSAITTCGTQTITLTGSGATTYTWSTGANSSTVSVAPSSNTTYTLTGKNNGCTNTTVATVTVNPLPATSLSASSPSICSGASATLSASGALTYSWSTGSTNTVITVSPGSATNYTVTGTNSFGCKKTATVTIGVNSLPSISSTSVTICSGKSGTVSASGGSSYSWNNGALTAQNVVSPTITTTYTVIGTAANSCTGSALAQVSVNALPVIGVNSTTLCSNKSATLTANGGNVYNWNTGNSGPSIIVSPSVSLSYTVTGTALTGCSNTAVSNVTVFNIPTMSSTPSVSPSNCGGSTGSITAVSVSGTPAFTYTWTNSSSSVVGNSANLNSQPAGTYNLQVKDGKGCVTSFGPYSIINPGAPSAPSASASANSLCVGGAINLFASSTATNATYTWSGPNSFSSAQQNPTLSAVSVNNGGVYSVFATSAGCSGAATNVTVTVNNNPVPNASANQSSYCTGNSINLFASSASTYTWSGPTGFTSSAQNPTITNASAINSGTYQLSVTDANGCLGSTSISVTVNSNPVISASAASTAVCAGNSITLNASGGNSYSWTGPNGFNSALQSPSIASSTLSSGTYSVNTTNTLTGCSSGTTINVQVNNLPTFTLTVASGSVCTNSTIQLTANGNNIAGYAWSGPSAFTGTGTVQSILNASQANAGNYSVTVTDGNGCQSAQSIPVYIYSLTPVSVTVSGNTSTLCTGSTVNLSGNSGASSYTWSGPAGFTSNLQNAVISNAQLNNNGLYTLTASDANGCTNTGTVNVNINPTPTISASSGALTCSGQSVTLSANFGNGASVNWFADVNASNTLAVNSSTYSPAISSTGTFTYFAQGLLNGCSSAVIPVVANYYNVVANYSASPVSGGAPLNVQFTNLSAGITNSDLSSWTFGDGNSSVSYNPSNTFMTPGTYTVTLIVSNGLCSDTTTGIIKVNPTLVEVPELLTPNGDNKNDVFDIKNIEYYPDNELQVFNRWGHLVYSMKGYKNEWEGSANANGKTSNGKLPTGTYFYLLKLNDGENQIFKGFCQLLY